MNIFTYPNELPVDHTDFVYFQHQSYRTNSSQRGGGASSLNGQGYAGAGDAPNDNNSIRLYMPNSTPTISNGNKWGENTFRGPLGKASQAAAGLIAPVAGTIGELGDGMTAQQMGRVAGEEVGNTLNKITVANAGDVGGQLLTDAAGYILPGFNSGDDVLAFSQGKIYNPNVELLYKGPTLRQFNMSFNFFARTRKESSTIDSIIKEFKMYSAPDDSADFLMVPHIWQVTYKMGGMDHPKMNKFKKAALQSIAVVDNSASNLHTTFEDGTPTVTTVSLSFTEVDMIFRKDHEEGPRGY